MSPALDVRPVKLPRPFYYRGVDDLNRLVVEWVPRLPSDIDLVVGVPRSGLLFAELLALHMHRPLTDIDGFEQGRTLGSGRRLATSAHGIRKALVVDDSVQTGQQLAAVKARLAPARHEILYAAAYVAPGAEHLVDFAFEVLPAPRIFEWNILHSWVVERSCVDIDGVLCRDPTTQENDDGGAYRRFLAEVPLRFRPSVPIKHLVTNRLERYRPETEAWLREHGIAYETLWMAPYQTAAQRRAARPYAKFKADVYAETGAMLFIESSIKQAREIAELSGRPVFCTDMMQMVYPGEAAGAKVVLWGAGPSLAIATRWYMHHVIDALSRRLLRRAWIR